MTDEWTELRRRYPWPTEPPDVPWTEQGWCGEELQEYFDKFLNEDTTLILEIGSWLGLSARYQMSIAPNAKIICVDHWKGSAEHHHRLRAQPGGKAPPGHWLEYLPNLYERFVKRMWEYQDRLVPMRTSSQKAFRELAELAFAPDFIYVDGSHDTNSVTADIDDCFTYFPKAKIMGDDFRLASVRIAVWRAMRKYQRPIEHNRLAWAIK